jgi:hypothetical protein
MDLPFDILDYIFSFLKYDPNALLKCSKAHSVLSQLVERYRFRHIIIHTGVTDFIYSFRPSDLRRHLAETPRIIQYVAVLEIEFKFYDRPHQMTPSLEEIASLLPMFPKLECIAFPTEQAAFSWQEDLPQSFRKSVENCLQLPTLQYVHVGDMSFPLSILDNHANINYLSLSGSPKIELEYRETPYPQINSLALERFGYQDSAVFRTWAKRHMIGLQSFRFDRSYHKIISEVLTISSDTLENLYLCVHRQGSPGELSSRLA